MSSRIFIMDADEFYIMLAIIFWFIGCLFSWNYPIITLLLYGIGLAFCYCAYKVIFEKLRGKINDIRFN